MENRQLGNETYEGLRIIIAKELNRASAVT